MKIYPKYPRDFYFSLCKQPVNPKKKLKLLLKKPRDVPEDTERNFYNNSSMKSECAAMNRYFKAEKGIDIISNPNFIKCNKIFQAVTKMGKEVRGEIQLNQPISDEDMSKLSGYFVINMNHST